MGTMRIRMFRVGDEAALAAVVYSSVHELAKGNYSSEQLDAWVPQQVDEAKWGERIRALHPFVAEIDGHIAGYADLQQSGYIDHFFVAGPYARQGVGAALMETIHLAAERRSLDELFADVSLSAESFFLKHGFVVEKRQDVVTRGVALQNARMRKQLKAAHG